MTAWFFGAFCDGNYLTYIVRQDKNTLGILWRIIKFGCYNGKKRLDTKKKLFLDVMITLPVADPEIRMGVSTPLGRTQTHHKPMFPDKIYVKRIELGPLGAHTGGTRLDPLMAPKYKPPKEQNQYIYNWMVYCFNILWRN